MGDLVTFKKKEKRTKHKEQVSYSDLVYTDFHDSIVAHINKIILIHKETEGDKDLCRMNVIAILAKILGEFLAAVHTKNVGNNYNLEGVKDYLEGRYEKGVMDFLIEDEQSVFILEDL